MLDVFGVHLVVYILLDNFCIYMDDLLLKSIIIRVLLQFEQKDKFLPTGITYSNMSVYILYTYMPVHILNLTNVEMIEVGIARVNYDDKSEKM